MVQDFWSFPGTLESGTFFSDCWNMLEPLASVARWRRAPSSALSNCPLCVLNVNERNQVFPTLQWWVGKLSHDLLVVFQKVRWETDHLLPSHS